MDAPAFFLHLPRTAGTTLNAVLRDNFAPDEILSIYCKEDYARHAAHSPEELAGIRLIQGHLFLPSVDPPAIYGIPVRPFTFVREPVARLMSEYAFLRSWQPNHLYTYLNDNHISFRQYMLGEERPLRYRGRNYMTRCIAYMDVGNDPLPRKALARAKANLERVFGFVGVQERFMESLLLLGDFLGLRTLLHERRNALADTTKAEVGTAISAEDRELCRELNAGDAALHAFALELLEQRVAAQGPGFARRLEELARCNEKYQNVCALLKQRTQSAQGLRGESPGAPQTTAHNTDVEGRAACATEGGPIVFSKDGLW